MCANAQSRFRQVPTFGRFTIRRFHNNVSEMKKLAARDFEDILQVRMSVPSMYLVDTGFTLVSVPSLRSKGFFPNHSMGCCSGYCTKLQNGTHSPNSDCTPTSPWISSRQLRRSSAISCDSSVTRPQRSSTPLNSLAEPTHVRGGRALQRRRH